MESLSNEVPRRAGPRVSGLADTALGHHHSRENTVSHISFYRSLYLPSSHFTISE